MVDVHVRILTVFRVSVPCAAPQKDACAGSSAREGIDRTKVDQFLISDKNFTLFYKRKDVAEYRAFFEAFYK